MAVEAGASCIMHARLSWLSGLSLGETCYKKSRQISFKAVGVCIMQTSTWMRMRCCAVG